MPPARRPSRASSGRPRKRREAFAREALEAGHEGIMAKALSAPYAAGRRGASWLKVKRPRTLDLVVLAVEWGHGRRQGWLSNLHLGARDPESNSFVMLGKTFKGMTDEMLAWQTEKLLTLEIGRDAYTVHVRPELVVEVAFNEIQDSPIYPGGLALRFARVKRYRLDKTAAEADTIETVQDGWRIRRPDAYEVRSKKLVVSHAAIQATWGHAPVALRSLERWFTSANRRRSARKPAASAIASGSAHDRRTSTWLADSIERMVREPMTEPRSVDTPMTTETMTANDASSARRPLAHREDTYRLPAARRIIVPANHPLTRRPSPDGLKRSRSAGNPTASSSTTPNVVPAFTVHCFHVAIGSSSWGSSVPKCLSSALASDPLRRATDPL